MKGLRLTEAQYAELLGKRGQDRIRGLKGQVDTKDHAPTYRGIKPYQEPSAIEETMALQIRAAGIRAPVRQHKPLALRKFRMDFAWPELRVGVEVQGAVHRIKGRWKGESERRALLQLAGWRVLEVNRDDIKSGRALTWLQQLLRQEETRCAS